MVPFDFPPKLARGGGWWPLWGSEAAWFLIVLKPGCTGQLPSPSPFPGLRAASPRPNPEAQLLPHLVTALAEANPVGP